MSFAELDAALLQATITLLVLVLCTALWMRTRRSFFGWWAVAWGFYLARLCAILAFLVTQRPFWLFAHQVVTGWTALALLWTSVVFAREAKWRSWFAILIAFPPVWSYLAIYRLDNFLLAAGPAIAFLSGATLVTAVLFFRHARRFPSAGATVLAIAFALWAVHHLDYPILRARGIWTPWGYYLDILFTLAVGAGILLLVNHELNERLLARTEELEYLSRRMVRQHEEERRRLSLALHDETAQVLAALKLQLGSVAERVDPHQRERVVRALDLVDTGLQSIRRLSQGLRPSLLDDIGLFPALRSLIAEYATQHRLHIVLNAPESLPTISDDAEVALYRALQEALSNIAQHASAAAVHVTIETLPTMIRISVHDTGPGFDDSRLRELERHGQLGLAGMRERVAAVGGTLAITSTRGAGTTVRLDIPASAAP